jgi:hypothetical protein
LTIKHLGFEFLEYLRERIEVRVTVEGRAKREALLEMENLAAKSPSPSGFTFRHEIGVYPY